MGKKNKSARSAPAGAGAAGRPAGSGGFGSVYLGLAGLACGLALLLWRPDREPVALSESARRQDPTGLIDEVPLEDILTAQIDPSSALWGSWPIQTGMHVLHRLDGPEWQYAVYRHATNQTRKLPGVHPDSGRKLLRVSAGSKQELWRELEAGIPINQHPAVAQGLKQKWQLYSAKGELLTGAPLSVLGRHRTMIAFEGGKWVFPGVKPGFKRTVLVESKPIELHTLSLKPLVIRVTPFLTDSEIKNIIDASQPHMQDSPVALMDHDQGKAASNWRTSTQHWLSGRISQVGKIQQRAEALLRVPRDHQEGSVQVLRYRHGQKYDAHNDFFDMRHYSKQPEMVRAYDNGHKNRLLALFWYMSDVPKGGETQFPRADGRSFDNNFVKCQGLKVKPEKGSAVLFYSLLPSGGMDHFSLHGGCPVLSKNHTKWAANQWVWNKRF